MMEPDLQRINVKLLADVPAEFTLDPFLAVFGRWRHEKDNPADWVDLADYAHMPSGQGILIVGHQGNFSIDLTAPGVGLLYCGKKDFEGTDEQRFAEAFRRCLALTRRLVSEPEYPAELKLRAGSWELAVNDRLEFPNNGETDRRLRPAVESAAVALFGSGDYNLDREQDPQRRYGYSIRSETVGGLDALLSDAAVRAGS